MFLHIKSTYIRLSMKYYKHIHLKLLRKAICHYSCESVNSGIDERTPPKMAEKTASGFSAIGVDGVISRLGLPL